MSLFPEDRELPADAIDSIQVRLSGLELKRPRIFGNVGWLVNCGGNWVWMSSGNNVCPKAGKR
jgi:hypothetical protein